MLIVLTFEYYVGEIHLLHPARVILVLRYVISEAGAHGVAVVNVVRIGLLHPAVLILPI